MLITVWEWPGEFGVFVAIDVGVGWFVGEGVFVGLVVGEAGLVVGAVAGDVVGFGVVVG